MSNITFRIGYHKCGSTFLNHNLFAQHSGIINLGRPYPSSSPVHRLMDHIVGSEDFDEAYCRKVIDEHIAPAVAGGLPVVISDGRLSYPAGSDGHRTFQRLRALFGDARILVTVRRQPDLIESFFLQIYGKGHTSGDVDSWIEKNWETGSRLAEMIDYDLIHNRLANEFGEQNVLIGLLETLQLSPDTFAATLSHFVGMDETETHRLITKPSRNERMSGFQERLMRYPRLYRAARGVYHSLPKSFVPKASALVGHDKPYRPVVSDVWQQRIVDICRPSNTRLAAKLDLDLESLGYMVDSP